MQPRLGSNHDLAPELAPVAPNLLETLHGFLTPDESLVVARLAHADATEVAFELGISHGEVLALRNSAAAKTAHLSLDDLQLLLDSGLDADLLALVTGFEDDEGEPAPSRTERLTPELFLDYWLPRRPEASDDFHRFGLHRTSRETALTRIHIQSNPSSTYRNLVVIDLDVEQPEWVIKTAVEEDENLPEPSFIVINRASGHAHVGWFIEGAAGTPKSAAWLSDITEKMTLRLRGDRSYHGTTMRNPLHRNHRTVWGTSHRYSLKELSSYVTDIVPRNSRLVKERLEEAGEGRNNTVRVLASEWAYRNCRHYTDYDEFFRAVMGAALAINDEEFPGRGLPIGEVKTIASSVAGWVWERPEFHAAGFAKLQHHRGVRSGEVRQEKAQGRHVEVLMMVDAGMSNREMSDVLGLSIDATKKAKRRANEWKLANPDAYKSRIRELSIASRDARSTSKPLSIAS